MKEKIKKLLSWIRKFFLKKDVPGLSNDEFKLLAGLLRYTYRQLWFSKIGHKIIGVKPYEKTWKNFQDVWESILISWRHYYLMNLANIFDRSVYRENKITLSILRIFPKSKFSVANQKTIKNLIQMRNETLAHLDRKALLRGKFSEENYSLDFEKEKIIALVGEAFKLLNEVRKNYDYPEELNQENEKTHVEARFDKWCRVFK